MYGTLMKKSPSIRAIFERYSDGNYTKDAQLYQYILKYCTKDNTLENDLVIRPWDLTDWLVDHYPEWRNLYQGRHLKKYSKIQYNLPRVKRKLDDLNSLFLLEEKTDKAQKVDTDIIIYYYTKSGNFLAWLLETDNSNLDKKATAIQKVYDILISHLSDKDTSRSVFLSEFFGRCRQEGVFIDAIYFLTSFEQARPMYNELALIESFLDVRKTLLDIYLSRVIH